MRLVSSMVFRCVHPRHFLRALSTEKLELREFFSAAPLSIQPLLQAASTDSSQSAQSPPSALAQQPSTPRVSASILTALAARPSLEQTLSAVAAAVAPQGNLTVFNVRDYGAL